MTQQSIVDILKMRMAVYQAGIKANFWADINKSGASEMMSYIFPKSGQIAYYNLILELMRKEHSMLIGGSFFLFKMPVQVEKEIMDYLKTNACVLSSMVSDSESYLQAMDTIVTDHCLTAVNIGSFNANDINILLSLCASHYRFSFKNGTKSYPYFE